MLSALLVCARGLRQPNYWQPDLLYDYWGSNPFHLDKRVHTFSFTPSQFFFWKPSVPRKTPTPSVPCFSIQVLQADLTLPDGYRVQPTKLRFLPNSPVQMMLFHTGSGFPSEYITMVGDKNIYIVCIGRQGRQTMNQA